MIIEKLKNFTYYYNKLPMYLRNSETFPEHFRIWVEIIQGMDNYADDMLGLVEVFDLNYLTKYGNICDDFLDKLGALYGVSREFSVKYEEEVEQGGTTQVVEVTKYLSLSQNEYIILLKTQIIKNFFDGTYEQIYEFYKKSNLPIVYITLNEGECNVILWKNILKSINSNSENIIDMFKSGLLTIESIGVSYKYLTLDGSEGLTWGNIEGTIGTQWDVGVWVL